jgi:hypothetical protein
MFPTFCIEKAKATQVEKEFSVLAVLPPEAEPSEFSALFPNPKIDSHGRVNLEHLALHSRAMLQPMAEP